MKFDGILFARARHLSWREATETDTYTDGSPIKSGSGAYVAIVSAKDCAPFSRIRDRKQFISAANAQCIPLTGHGNTNMAYGVQRHYKKGYITQPVYLVSNGKVYQGRIKKANPHA